MKSPDEWVDLAAVARSHGVRGEVRLRLYNQDSDLLLDQEEVLLRLPSGEEHEVSVDGARRANDAILMKLHSVDDRDRADELRGAIVAVRRRDFPPVEDGEFYVCDIVGAKVIESGQELGVVRELRSYPTVDALVISSSAGEWELPLLDQFVGSVDAAAGVVTVKSTEGLDRAGAEGRPARDSDRAGAEGRPARDADGGEPAGAPDADRDRT